MKVCMQQSFKTAEDRLKESFNETALKEISINRRNFNLSNFQTKPDYFHSRLILFNGPVKKLILKRSPIGDDFIYWYDFALARVCLMRLDRTQIRLLSVRLDKHPNGVSFVNVHKRLST